MSVKVGFIGAGNIANTHARSLAASNADLTFVAVFDPESERAKRFASLNGSVVCDSAIDVIERSEAVYVCTWTSDHEANVRLIAEAGKAVFCEKPLGTDLAMAERMVDVVRAADVVNQVGLVLRNSPVFHLLRHLVHSQDAGRPMSVIFRDDQFLPVRGSYASTWRADVDKAGAGVLIEHSIHDIDLLEWIYGPIASVSAESSHVHGIEGIEDVVSVNLSFESGVIGSLTSVWHELSDRASNRQVEVFNETLWAQLRGEWYGDVTWTIGEDSGELSGQELVDYSASVSPGSGENPDANFIRSVRAGTTASPSMKSALRAHVVVDACYRSAATGQRIDVAANYGRADG